MIRIMKLRLAIFVLLVLVAAAGCSGPQTGEVAARRALDEAAAAMGGWEALRNVGTQRVVSEGSDWAPIQAMYPGDSRHVSDFSITRTADYEKEAARMEYSGDLYYPRERSLSYTEVIEGDAGMREETGSGGEVTQSRMHGSVYVTRLRNLRRMPVRVLLTASEAQGLDRVPDKEEEGSGGGHSVQVLRYQDAGQTVELRIDAATHLPASAAYLEDDVTFSDTRNAFVWTDWRDVSGVMLPFSQEKTLNGQLIRKETIQEIQNNPSVDSAAFAIPEPVRQAPEPGERIISQWPLRRVSMGVTYMYYAGPQDATLEEVVPGVWLAKGAGHQSLVVEMADHVMTFEAPLFEERSLEVIAAIKEKFPDKPIRYTMMTHYHQDHSGGVRTYAAEGATIIAHANIVPFVEGVLKAPKTINPDSLAGAGASSGSPPQYAVEGVDSMKEYTDGSRVVQIYPLPNPHVRDMLALYMPRERITLTADLVTGSFDPSNIEDRARAYYAFVKQEGLNVDRIVRVHGPPLSFREFAAVMEKAQ